MLDWTGIWGISRYRKNMALKIAAQKQMGFFRLNFWWRLLFLVHCCHLSQTYCFGCRIFYNVIYWEFFYSLILVSKKFHTGQASIWGVWSLYQSIEVFLMFLKSFQWYLWSGGGTLSWGHSNWHHNAGLKFWSAIMFIKPTWKPDDHCFFFLLVSGFNVVACYERI